MDKKRNYDNDGLDPSEEYYRRKQKGNDEDTYFPPEESGPPHYQEDKTIEFKQNMQRDLQLYDFFLETKKKYYVKPT